MPVRKWGGEKRVNTTTVGDQREPTVAALADGGYVVAWTDGSSGVDRPSFQRFTAAGAAVGAEGKVSFGVANAADSPSITGLSDGGFVIAGQYPYSSTDQDIRAALYNASGTFVSSFPIASDGAYDEGRAQLAKLGTGFVAAYSRDDNTLFAARFSNTGALFGSATQVNTTAGAAAPDVAQLAFGTNFVVAWQTSFGTQIRARVFDSTGMPINNQADFAVSTAGTTSSGASVTGLANGGFVVTWDSYDSSDSGVFYDIRARVFDRKGNALTSSDFVVNTSVEGDQANAETVALRGGGFAVVWYDGATLSIRGQLFDARGGFRGDEFVVNTSTVDRSLAYGEALAITELADGRLAVTWRMDANGSTDVFQQIIDPRDGVVNGTFAGETLYGNDLVNDEINGLGGNDALLGLKGDDVLFGGDGSDGLDGGVGNDVLWGGNENDTLRGGVGQDELYGEGGSDTALYSTAASAVTVSLDGMLAATGEAAGDILSGIENLLGTKFGDRLRGNAGANILNGGLGNDRLEGGTGSDAYFVDAAGDIVVEAVETGSTDTVYAYVSYTLGAGVSVEVLRVADAASTVSQNLAGNELAQTIIGSKGANGLLGRGGNDTLTGGLGDDVFYFDRALTAGSVSNLDRISDFANAAGNNDRIALDDAIFTKLTAAVVQAGGFLAANADGVAKDNNDFLVFETDTGKLYYDSNANIAGGAVQFATLSTYASLIGAAELKAADFIVY